MTDKKNPENSEQPLAVLKHLTNARIALGHAGISQPTRAHLNFQLAHAMARDAVHVALDFSALEQALVLNGQPILQLQTRAENHQFYLQRPDLGKLLEQHSIESLQQYAAQMPAPDIALTVIDGLSSKAIENHAEVFLDLLIPNLKDFGYSLSPVCLVRHGRVAVGDHIAELLCAKMVIVLIGERPGLSSPDSMGIYFTYDARPGSTDAQRNCISNIHGNGLDYPDALHKLLYLVNEAERLQYSGVHLKDETSHDSSLKNQSKQKNFLLD